MSLKWGYKGRGLRKNSRQSATGKALGRIISCLLQCVWPLTVLEGVRWFVVREFFLSFGIRSLFFAQAILALSTADQADAPTRPPKLGPEHQQWRRR